LKRGIVSKSDPIALVGGAELAPEHLNILQTLTDLFIAADSGADHLLDSGVLPQLVVGDFDSISPQARRKFAPQLVHVAEQDSTDLEKALSRAQAPVIIGAGFLGGRIDHSFAAFSVLAKNPDIPLILLSNTECCFRCPDAGAALRVPVGTGFAVLPMADITATTTGLRWDMDGLPLSPSGFVSSSNATAAPDVTIAVTGSAILTLPLAQLNAAIGVVRAE